MTKIARRAIFVAIERALRMKKILTSAVLIVSIIVFVISGVQLYRIFSEYRKGTSEYEALKDIAIHIELPEVEEGTVVETYDVDFAALKEINPEVVGWLRFDEPAKIHYPVVYSGDNSKYLTTTFEGKKNAAGTLFVDAENDGTFEERNTFIHGHNMKNGSMFGQLRKYKDSSFGEKHPYFYIYMPDGTMSIYQVFAVCIVKDVSESYNKWFSSSEEFGAYIDYVRNIALYPTDVEVGADAKIVSLSTCTNVKEDERLVVHGVKIANE